MKKHLSSILLISAAALFVVLSLYLPGAFISGSAQRRIGQYTTDTGEYYSTDMELYWGDHTFYRKLLMVCGVWDSEQSVQHFTSKSGFDDSAASEYYESDANKVLIGKTPVWIDAFYTTEQMAAFFGSEYGQSLIPYAEAIPEVIVYPHATATLTSYTDKTVGKYGCDIWLVSVKEEDVLDKSSFSIMYDNESGAFTGLCIDFVKEFYYQDSYSRVEDLAFMETCANLLGYADAVAVKSQKNIDMCYLPEISKLGLSNAFIYSVKSIETGEPFYMVTAFSSSRFEFYIIPDISG